MKKFITVILTICLVLIPTKVDAMSVIVIIDSGMCGQNVKYVCYYNTLTGITYLDIEALPTSGDCCIYSYKSKDAPPWVSYRSSVNVLTVRGVVEFGSYCFYGFSGCYSFNFDDSVLVMGNYCLANCDRLGYLDMPEQVVYVGKSAFMGDSSLVQIDFSPALTSIGNYAFAKCNLQSVKLPNKLRSVGKYAFAYNRGLQYLQFGKSDLKLGAYAFSGCTSLGEVKPPKWVKYKNTTFRGCK